MSRFRVLVPVASYLLLSSATAQVISKLPADLVYSSIELDPGEEAACVSVRGVAGHRGYFWLAVIIAPPDLDQTPQSLTAAARFFLFSRLSSLFVNNALSLLFHGSRGVRTGKIFTLAAGLRTVKSPIVLSVACFSLIRGKVFTF